MNQNFEFYNTSDYYFEQMDQPTQSWRARNTINLLDLDKSIIEIGCGSGRNLRAIPSAFGTDISLIGLIRINRENLFVSDISNLPIKDNAFDQVVNIAVLEHVMPDKVESSINELIRICNYRVHIRTPNFARERVIKVIYKTSLKEIGLLFIKYLKYKLLNKCEIYERKELILDEGWYSDSDAFSGINLMDLEHIIKKNNKVKVIKSVCLETPNKELWRRLIIFSLNLIPFVRYIGTNSHIILEVKE